MKSPSDQELYALRDEVAEFSPTGPDQIDRLLAIREKARNQPPAPWALRIKSVEGAAFCFALLIAISFFVVIEYTAFGFHQRTESWHDLAAVIIAVMGILVPTPIIALAFKFAATSNSMEQREKSRLK